jgi:hypothetical protein
MGERPQADRVEPPVPAPRAESTEPLPSRSESLPSRGESLPSRGEPLPSRGESLPSRGESVLPLRGRMPLPRREGQTHIAPQLRTAGDASGTPFAAFAATVPGPDAAAERDAATAFRDGSRRARGRRRPAPPKPADGERRQSR